MSWYKNFFQKFYDLYITAYDPDVFTNKRVKKEVNFIEKALKLKKGDTILDLCGGRGRHGIELAKRGYQVVILDLNSKFLQEAKKKAKENNINVEVVKSDMRKIPFRNRFDAVINMFNSFGYLENKKEDVKAIRQIHKSLKPKGKLLIDLVNYKNIITSFFPRDWREVGDYFILENRAFNRRKKLLLTEIIFFNKKTKKKLKAETKLRVYSFSQLKELLEFNGFRIQKVYGDFDFQQFSKSSKRMIILAQTKG